MQFLLNSGRCPDFEKNISQAAIFQEFRCLSEISRVDLGRGHKSLACPTAMPPRQSKRPAAPTAPTQKALAIAREQQQSREAARCKKNAGDPRRLVVYEYTPERLLTGLEKRSWIKLMIARWKCEPYACSNKTTRRRRQRDETAPSGLRALTQSWQPWMSRVFSLVEDHFYQYVSCRLNKALLVLRCSVLLGIYQWYISLQLLCIAIPAKQRLSNTVPICSWRCCAAIAAADAAVGAAAASTAAAAAAAILRSSCQCCAAIVLLQRCCARLETLLML